MTRKLLVYELYDLQCPQNIIWVIKSRRLRWAGHVAVWGRRDVYSRFWWGNLRERDHLEDPGVDGRIILSWIFRKWDVGAWLRKWTGGGHL